MFKVGLALGKDALKLDGSFQLGYHSKIDKKYTPVTSKYEGASFVDGRLPTIEDGEEEGGVSDASLLQS